MWTKCWNCICRLAIVLMIIISLCYCYFSPIAYRTKNFLIMFFLLFYFFFQKILVVVTIVNIKIKVIIK